VAGIASGTGDVVVVARVALIAVGDDTRRGHLVIADKSPACGGVGPRGRRKRGVDRVAVGAVRCGEGGARRGVDGIVGAVVIRLVTIRLAAARRRREIIAARRGGVALSALHGGVQSGEWEAGVVVIESRVRPSNHVVAGVAGLRESGGNVVRDISAQSLRAGPVRGVAGIASRAIQVVIVARVALRAICDLASGSQLVATGQGPAGDRMVEGVVGPSNGVVAG